MAPATEYRSSRPLRRLLFALGSLLVVAMVAWGTAQALDQLSIEEEHVVLSYSGVASIDLRHSHGNVDLVRAPGRRVRVTIDARHGFLGGEDRKVRLAAGELELRGRCRFLSVGTCEEDYRIEVPRGVTVAVRTSAGETVARGLRGGDLDLRSSAGPVRAEDVRARDVELRSSAGPVDAVGIRATELRLHSSAGGVSVSRSAVRRLDADSSAGGIDAELVSPPLSVDAHSSAGGVTLRVPDVGYLVDAHTSAGEESVEVRQRARTRRKIVVDSSAGDVNVLPLATAPPEPRDAASPRRSRRPSR